MSSKPKSSLTFDPKRSLTIDQEQLAINRFERALMRLLSTKSWYGPLSCEVTKQISYDVPTMGVTYKDGRFLFVWNPNFVLDMNVLDQNGKPAIDSSIVSRFDCVEATYRFNEEMCVAVIEHEYLHLLLDHIGRSAKYKGLPHNLLNVAADCAINQHLANLPDWTCHPARMTPPLPADGAFEPYTEILLERADKSGADGDGDGDGNSFFEGDGSGSGEGDEQSAGKDGVLDDHSGWKDVSPADRKFQSEKIKSIQGKVAQKMAGSGQGGVLQELLKLLEEQVNWRSALRRFTQKTISSMREFTTTRPNRREWNHPGSRKTIQCNLLFAIDVSGSMSDADINAVYADVYALQKKYKIAVDVAIFDDGIQLLQKGEKFIKCPRICGRGGTSFEEVIQYADNPAVRKEVNARLNFHGQSSYAGVVIYSDMCVGAPSKPKRTRVMFMGTPDGAKKAPVDWGFYIECKDPQKKHED